ncbi:MAG TPA: helix-turn-helix domain-containing protein [Candidatus Limnocylindrales bacterium]|nr:helix-turn-helix domain-containing protein [Candidatus Limnocylindrales bacterium]
MALSIPIATANADGHLARRWEIWHASAPLFQKYGFRAVTVDQLAYASAMSPAGLYHYFPNKAAIALFPLAHGNGLCLVWDAIVDQLPEEPALRLEALAAFAADHAAAWRLSFGLASQMSRTPALERYAGRLLADARRDFAEIARRVDPRTSNRRIADLHEALTAIIVADLPGFDQSTEAIRRRLLDAVRGWLAAVATDPVAPSTTGSDTRRLPAAGVQRFRNGPEPAGFATA